MNKLAKPPNLTLIRDRTPLIAVTLILTFARCTQECLLNRPKTFPVKSTRRHSIEPAGDFTKQTPRQEQPSTAICVYVWVHIRVWVFGCVDVSDLFGNIQVKMLQYYSEKQNKTWLTVDLGALILNKIFSLEGVITLISCYHPCWSKPNLKPA